MRKNILFLTYFRGIDRYQNNICTSKTIDKLRLKRSEHFFQFEVMIWSRATLFTS